MPKKEKLYTFEEAYDIVGRHIEVSAERLYQKLIARKNESSKFD